MTTTKNMNVLGAVLGLIFIGSIIGFPLLGAYFMAKKVKKTVTENKAEISEFMWKGVSWVFGVAMIISVLLTVAHGCTLHRSDDIPDTVGGRVD